MPNSNHPHPRLTFITHQDKAMLRANFAHIDTQEAGQVLLVLVDWLRQQPEKSVRVLFDTTGAKYDPAQSIQWKSYSDVFMKHMNSSAVIGLNPLVRATVNTFLNLLEVLGYKGLERHGRVFENEAEALTWLANN